MQLIPLPIATDDHQAANTREIVKAGGARMIRQDKFAPKELAKLLADQYGPADVLRIISAFYGLTEYPRLSWLDAATNLEAGGWRQLQADSCVFILLRPASDG